MTTTFPTAAVRSRSALRLVRVVDLTPGGGLRERVLPAPAVRAAECLLVEAAAYARDLVARLQVVHAEWRPSSGTDRVLDQRVSELGDLVTVRVRTTQGDASTALLDAADTSGLVVVGRHHPHRAGGSRLGQVARVVVRDASCPVLLPTPVQSVSSAEWVFQTSWA